LVIASWQGREPQALELIEDSIQEAAARGEGRAISLSEFAGAVLYNGLGRYDLALAAARRVCEHDDLALLAWGLVELVEASARCNQPAERLGRTRIRLALGRAHLLYGEWLRREGRRVDAREQLHLAHDIAESSAPPARRCESESRRPSTTSPHRSPRSSGWPGEGATNSEIASQMFISERPVEWHMRKVFAKLGISSRRQLRRQPGPTR
jgi:Bacterial regulatory proteins, luxR family